MAALRLACGATDEEWPEVMGILGGMTVPLTADEVVANLRAALAEVRREG
jgi:hypothetical protein